MLLILNNMLSYLEGSFLLFSKSPYSYQIFIYIYIYLNDRNNILNVNRKYDFFKLNINNSELIIFVFQCLSRHPLIS